MTDSFTETTTKSWGARIINSIKWILFWFILFIASFILLYWNEWRIDISKIAKTAIEIDSKTKAPLKINQKLISTTGIFKSDEKIWDTYLKEWNYLWVNRKTEMYAWKEKSESKTKKNLWGSETKETTYTYSKEWTSFPSNSSNFKRPEWHLNPKMRISSNSIKVSKWSIWIYNTNISELRLPWYDTLNLNKTNTIIWKWFKLADNKHIFNWSWSIWNPSIWDIRISYSKLNNPLKNITIFWKINLDSKSITAFYWKKNSKLFRAFKWNRDGAISKMKTEHKIITWWLRIWGFIMMWIWLNMLLGTISVILDVLPFLWTIGRAWVWLITFLIALSLSIITIIISMIIHNLIALIIVIVLFIWWVFWYLKNKKVRK